MLLRWSHKPDSSVILTFILVTIIIVVSDVPTDSRRQLWTSLSLLPYTVLMSDMFQFCLSVLYGIFLLFRPPGLMLHQSGRPVQAVHPTPLNLTPSAVQASCDNLKDLQSDLKKGPDSDRTTDSKPDVTNSSLPDVLKVEAMIRQTLNG
jgi:hypothetical protein